jgi:putative zinc finger protein
MPDMHPEPAQPRSGHLESGEVAAYLESALAPSERTRVEAHLADCDACRMEVAEVARLVRARPSSRRWYLPVGAVAAAALLLLILRPGQDRVEPPDYREPVITTTIAPVAIAPRGAITTAERLIWSSVPHADRYQVAVFDDTGRVLWETQTSDTATVIPDRIRFQTGAPYHWKVKAQTSWNRWVSSDLVEFSIGPLRL